MGRETINPFFIRAIDSEDNSHELEANNETIAFRHYAAFMRDHRAVELWKMNADETSGKRIAFFNRYGTDFLPGRFLHAPGW